MKKSFLNLFRKSLFLFSFCGLFSVGVLLNNHQKSQRVDAEYVNLGSGDFTVSTSQYNVSLNADTHYYGPGSVTGNTFTFVGSYSYDFLANGTQSTLMTVRFRVNINTNSNQNVYLQDVNGNPELVYTKQYDSIQDSGHFRFYISGSRRTNAGLNGEFYFSDYFVGGSSSVDTSTFYIVNTYPSYQPNTSGIEYYAYLINLDEVDDMYEHPYFSQKIIDFDFSDVVTSDYDLGYGEGYNSGYDDGYNQGQNEGFNSGYSQGSQQGYSQGFADGQGDLQSQLISAYNSGYSSGYNEGSSTDQTASTIFSGILQIAMVPVNFFLGIFNFEILGINMASFVSALLTVAVTIIIIRTIFGGKSDDK